jgi:RsiW-degrading membrane proteinase PrsW (M82 family)
MENSSEQKDLQTVSFVVHATRGVIRNQNTRRKATLFLLALVLVLLILGFTFLQPTLNPHEHPWRVILFWIVCIWLTFTAMLLALFDLLVLRLEVRRGAARLAREVGSYKIDIEQMMRW